MGRSQELHYITPIPNVPSVLAHGILCHNRARKVQHDSCASQEIQERRSRVIVPNGRPLHEYANLYFNARNPMMHLLKDNHNNLTVLALSPDIIDLPGVVITDRNASRDFALFLPAPNGLDIIDQELVFAEYWTNPNPIYQHEHKGIMCAEVLVPDKIDAEYIVKAYTSGNTSRTALADVLSMEQVVLETVVNAHLFFR